MATYPQVFKSTAQGRRQLWYIYGMNEPVRQDCLELALEHVKSGAESVEKILLFGDKVTASDIMDALDSNTYSDRLLVILYEAEKFTQWDEMREFLSKLEKNRFFIAMSAEEKLESGVAPSSLFTGSTKARCVNCTTMQDKDIALWIQTRVNITPDAAAYLVRQSNYDYEWLLNQMRRLERLPFAVVELRVVQVLCRTEGKRSFVGALLGQRKVGALEAVYEGSTEAGTVLALVENLEKLSKINEGLKQVGSSGRQLVERTGLTLNEISVLQKSALYYDLQVVTRNYAALVKLEESLKHGRKEAFYALATRW